MNRRVLLLVISLIISNSTAHFKSLSHFAIKGIIDEYYSSNDHQIQVVNFGTRNEAAENTIEKLFKLSSTSISIQLSNHAFSSRIRLNISSILLFDSPEHFNRLKNTIMWQPNSKTTFRHLVYFPKGEIKDIETFQSAYIHAIDFLVDESRNSIKLVTAFLFSPGACRKIRINVINRFTRGRMKWENSNFFLEKFKDFHKCNISVGYNKHSVHEVYSILANQLNFRLFKSKKKSFLDDQFSFLYSSLVPVLMERANVFITDIEIKKMYIPPGELFGVYEKMVLPFDTGAWIAIFLTLLLVFSGIFIIKRFPKEIQAAIFGTNNPSPLMNFISIFLNGGQHSILIKNAPRFFLFIVIFWSLIIR
jgi:hypothetical protein